MYLDLVISGEGVHKTEKLVFGGGVDYQVNLWQIKTIFWTCFVEVGKDNTHSPLPPFFGGTPTLASQF